MKKEQFARMLTLTLGSHSFTLAIAELKSAYLVLVVFSGEEQIRSGRKSAAPGYIQCDNHVTTSVRIYLNM